MPLWATLWEWCLAKVEQLVLAAAPPHIPVFQVPGQSSQTFPIFWGGSPSLRLDFYCSTGTGLVPTGFKMKPLCYHDRTPFPHFHPSKGAPAHQLPALSGIPAWSAKLVSLRAQKDIVWYTLYRTQGLKSALWHSAYMNFPLRKRPYQYLLTWGTEAELTVCRNDSPGSGPPWSCRPAALPTPQPPYSKRGGRDCSPSRRPARGSWELPPLPARCWQAPATSSPTGEGTGTVRAREPRAQWGQELAGQAALSPYQVRRVWTGEFHCQEQFHSVASARKKLPGLPATAAGSLTHAPHSQAQRRWGWRQGWSRSDEAAGKGFNSGWWGNQGF